MITAQSEFGWKKGIKIMLRKESKKTSWRIRWIGYPFDHRAATTTCKATTHGTPIWWTATVSQLHRVWAFHKLNRSWPPPQPINLAPWACSSKWNWANSSVTSWYTLPSNSHRTFWVINKQLAACLRSRWPVASVIMITSQLGPTH